MEDLDTNYIKNFEQLEINYKKFYNKEVNKIQLFFIYINKHKEIYNIKKETENLTNSYLNKERIIYLIKNNQYNLQTKHKLVSLLKFNIDLNYTQLNNFILNKVNDNYLSSLSIIDDIKFKDTIPLLEDLNCIFFIYSFPSSNEHTNINTTKRIHFSSIKAKTRRK
jgi:hypothetical protein